jgi:tetratricopeptide (TPR) repeat protein
MAKGTNGEIAAALPDATRALEILERRFGTDGRRLHEPLLLLGELARQRGEPAEAERHWSRAVAIAERHHMSPGELAPTLVNLAIIDLEAGKIEAGLERLEIALPLFESYMGRNSPALTDTLVARAYALRALGHYAASRQDLERAVVLSAKGYGPVHPTTTNAQIELANTYVAAGDRASAIAMLTAQMVLVDGDPGGRPPQQPIELRLALASAHWANGERDAARRVAADAADKAGEAEPGHSMVAAWRAEHR